MTYPKRCRNGLITSIDHGMSSMRYKQHLHFCDQCEAFHDYISKKVLEYYLPTYDDEKLEAWARERGVI